MTYSTQFLGKIVTVTIDRPLGSKHPRYDSIYPLNYGYIEGVKAPDGHYLDAYVLGFSKPMKKFRGKCIAVIQREDDDDDKLIVVPEGMTFSDDEIIKLTFFQEKYFKSKVVRA